MSSERFNAVGTFIWARYNIMNMYMSIGVLCSRQLLAEPCLGGVQMCSSPTCFHGKRLLCWLYSASMSAWCPTCNTPRLFAGSAVILLAGANFLGFFAHSAVILVLWPCTDVQQPYMFSWEETSLLALQWACQRGVLLVTLHASLLALLWSY